MNNASGSELMVPSDTVARFREILSAGLSKIYEACEIYVKAIDADPSAKRLFAEQCRDIPAAAWSAFEMVGRKAMDYRLLWGGGKAQSSLRRLPKSDQTILLDNGVPIACGDGEHRIVQVEALERDDIEQVFNHGRVRTLDEQRAWLARQVEAKRAVMDSSSDADYYVAGGKLVVMKPMRIPLSTLARMMRK